MDFDIPREDDDRPDDHGVPDDPGWHPEVFDGIFASPTDGSDLPDELPPHDAAPLPPDQMIPALEEFARRLTGLEPAAERAEKPAAERTGKVETTRPGLAAPPVDLLTDLLDEAVRRRSADHSDRDAADAIRDHGTEGAPATYEGVGPRAPEPIPLPDDSILPERTHRHVQQVDAALELARGDPRFADFAQRVDNFAGQDLSTQAAEFPEVMRQAAHLVARFLTEDHDRLPVMAPPPATREQDWKRFLVHCRGARDMLTEPSDAPSQRPGTSPGTARPDTSSSRAASDPVRDTVDARGPDGPTYESPSPPDGRRDHPAPEPPGRISDLAIAAGRALAADPVKLKSMRLDLGRVVTVRDDQERRELTSRLRDRTDQAVLRAAAEAWKGRPTDGRPEDRSAQTPPPSSYRDASWLAEAAAILIQDVLFELAKAALFEMLLPGTTVLLPPTGLVDALFTAAGILTVVDGPG
ncbi:hypothetical protein [Mangrovihabitans endophyticus]|uniref:Uncharacterized protein n=1 Tax=Mangrovihabitans endophyticus TaxID=1751298 RepID=A0A8J3BUI0_9ACTN|nr:hypothetical protein [Mangrovihabitans endophyticus]GGK78514.1 hypothetical protein GCM10012284_10520 [Mangrovihabitans endophyticus]